MPNFVEKSWKPGVKSHAFVCWHFIKFPPPMYYFHSMHCYRRGGGNSVSKKSTQKTFPPSEEKSFAPINNELLRVSGRVIYITAFCKLGHQDHHNCMKKVGNLLQRMGLFRPRVFAATHQMGYEFKKWRASTRLYFSKH